MPVRVEDSEWDRYGWAVPWLPEEYQPDRKVTLQKDQEDRARRLLEQCNLKSTSLKDQATGQTNG